jgi:cytidylate kinase
MSRKGLVVAIDGPSGAGKSTVGRALAERLGYIFVDTGAMYRAIAWKALEQGVPLDDEAAMADVAINAHIELTSYGRVVKLDGHDVTTQIRSREVTAAASRTSAYPAVRRAMVAQQRELGRQGGIVLDGRDIGTAVFPDAEVKFYVDADPLRRAQRRHSELAEKGHTVDVHQIAEEIRARDHADSTRADSPLTRAEDAIYIDTTTMIPAEVIESMLSSIEAKMAEKA